MDRHQKTIRRIMRKINGSVDIVGAEVGHNQAGSAVLEREHDDDFLVATLRIIPYPPASGTRSRSFF